MKTKTIQINIFEKRAFFLLVFVILTLISFYIYFISKSIINVIVREEISKDAVAVSSKIGELEFKYITHKNAINKEFAKQAGFEDIAEKKFVARKSFARNIVALNLEN